MSIGPQRAGRVKIVSFDLECDVIDLELLNRYREATGRGDCWYTYQAAGMAVRQDWQFEIIRLCVGMISAGQLATRREIFKSKVRCHTR